ATQAAVAASIVSAFNASIETAHTSVTASAVAGVITFTADNAGTAFTLTGASAEAGVISLTADTAGKAFSASVSATQAGVSDIAAVRSEVQKNLDKATGDAITSADENFTANGAFLRSGLLNITTTFENSVTGVTARFTTSDGEVVAMTAELDVAAGTVTLKQASGDNAKIISDDLTYTFKDPTGAVEELGGRKLSLDVAVPGTIPAMSTGDLVINGVVIGASYTADDSLSPPNNASGSAIAKAAAINRYTEETGVFAVVNENIMGGAPQSGTSIVTGRVVINGIESSLITTVLNNTRESRAATITAINQIADKSGVSAIDTEDDDEGVRLLARDGRNIEVRFVTDYPITDFGARTGLREGVQAGTYSLETKVEGELVVTTTDTGVIERSGLKLGDFTKNESTLSTAARKPITNGQTPVALNAGDLVINGVSIRGAMTSDDKSTDPIALVTDSNIRAASAVAIAAAINASTEQTGVRATANPVVLESDLTTIDASRTDGRYKLWVNGAEVEVEFRQTHTASERVNAVIAAITPKFGATGIVAEANAKGGLTLTTQDGRNLSVWFDDTQDAAAGAPTLKPEEFGLAMVSTGKAAEGVTSKTDAATIANASTLYGGVTLHSEKAFTIEPGGNGYAARSNFTALGFQEGTFGGEVDEATTKMSPPRTGRLTFHVGASAGQVITIDLADFGSGGPVTGDITNDVAAGDGANRVNRIDSAASASSVLEKLDVAMDKVNATRGRMGAVMNRLEHVIDNLMNVSMHSEASRSQIEDADYAAASTELARTQIMQQAATAVLAQANASQQNVLSLLQ
ncbi:MAG: flagellin, partial [Burkholderiaceae bacterium]